MCTQSTDKTVRLQIDITLNKFQSQLPADGQNETILVTPLVGLLGKTVDFPQCDLGLQSTDITELEACSKFTWQSSGTNDKQSLIELLEILLNEAISVKLRNDATDEIIAAATCPIDAQIPGNNPIRLDDIPLLLIDGDSVGSETLARLSFAVTVSKFIAEDQEVQIIQCLPEDDGRSTTVVEITPAVLSPIPQTLTTAFSLVSSQLDTVFGMCLLDSVQEEEENEQGDVQRTIPLILKGAILTDEELKWPKGLKRIFTGAQLRKLKESLTKKQTVPVEIWRQLSEEAMKSHTDPAFEHYNAIALMDLSDLLTPGTKSVDLQLEFNESCKDYVQQNSAYKALAPEPAKTKTNLKLKPIEDASRNDLMNAWKNSDSVLHLTLRFSHPLTPPWEPPNRPSKTLRDLIHVRENPPTIDQCPTSWTVFKDKVKEVISSVQKETKQIKDSSQTQKWKGEELDQYKDLLREPITDIAKQMFDTHSLTQIQGRKNELYVKLMQLVEETRLSQETTEVVDPTQLSQLWKLARDYEEGGGMLHLARRKLLDLLVLDPTSQTWTEYGAFCLRMMETGVGEESLKRGLMEDEGSLETLVLLSCSMINCGIGISDGGPLAEAEVLLHEALQKHPESIQVWGLLTILYTSLGRATEEQNCRHKVHELCKNQDKECQEVDPLIQLIGLCIEHNCLLCAENLLSEEEGSNDKTILLAKLALKRGDFESGLKILKTCTFQEGTEASVEIQELEAKTLCQMGCEDKAKQVYKTLMTEQANLCSATTFVSYGRLLARQDHQDRCQWAENVFLEGIGRFPDVACLWSELGNVLFDNANFIKAELAWNEASRIDPTNPELWAKLSLLYLELNHTEASNQALSHAIAQGIEDTLLLTKIIKALVSKGLNTRANRLILTLRESGRFRLSEVSYLESLVDSRI